MQVGMQRVPVPLTGLHRWLGGRRGALKALQVGAIQGSKDGLAVPVDRSATGSQEGERSVGQSWSRAAAARAAPSGQSSAPAA